MSKILLTGSTGYIGRRLLPLLVSQGHQVVCLVRDRRRFDFQDFDEQFLSKVEIMEADLSKASTLEKLPEDIDAAYYLVHSMTSSSTNFEQLEHTTAKNFAAYVSKTKARQIVY